MNKKIDYKKLAEVYEGMIDKKNTQLMIQKDFIELQSGTADLLNQVIRKLNVDVEHEKFKFNFLSIIAILALIFIILI